MPFTRGPRTGFLACSPDAGGCVRLGVDQGSDFAGTLQLPWRIIGRFLAVALIGRCFLFLLWKYYSAREDRGMLAGQRKCVDQRNRNLHTVELRLLASASPRACSFFFRLNCSIHKNCGMLGRYRKHVNFILS